MTIPGPDYSPGFWLWHATLRWQREIAAVLAPLGLTHVQFVLLSCAWWLNDHITEGKKELNFSQFGSFTYKRKIKKLKKVVSEVEEGGMPLNSYTWIHKDAVLSPAEKRLLVEWAKGLSQKILQDSLQKH